MTITAIGECGRCHETRVLVVHGALCAECLEILEERACVTDTLAVS